MGMTGASRGARLRKLAISTDPPPSAAQIDAGSPALQERPAARGSRFCAVSSDSEILFTLLRRPGNSLAGYQGETRQRCGGRS